MMAKKKKEKPDVLVLGTGTGRSYNRLDEEAREWARSNRLPTAERCSRVEGGNRFKGPDWIKEKCGDGSMGFSMRRKGHEENNVTMGGDGHWKSARGSLVNRKSAKACRSRAPKRIDGSRCSIATKGEIHESEMDPKVKWAKRELAKIRKSPRVRMNRRERKFIAARIDKLTRIVAGF